MKTWETSAVILSLSLLAFSHLAVAADGVEHIKALNPPRTGMTVVLKGTDVIRTQATFQPPVEITVEAKTDSTDLRLGYAADQMIFNWSTITHELRVDGGPAGGKHKAGAGLIPVNKYVIVRWVVTPAKQSVYVDGQLCFEHEGDYSKINNPVSIFSNNSKVTVKSIKVKALPTSTP